MVIKILLIAGCYSGLVNSIDYYVEQERVKIVEKLAYSKWQSKASRAVGSMESTWRFISRDSIEMTITRIDRKVVRQTTRGGWKVRPAGLNKNTLELSISTLFQVTRYYRITIPTGENKIKLYDGDTSTEVLMDKVP